jgi:hypothetical protein
MRKLWIVLAAVFATSLLMTAGVDAAKYSTKSKAHHKVTAKMHCKTMMHHKMMHHKKMMKKAIPAKAARGPVWVCKKVYRHHKMIRRAKAAGVARGPMVTCPAPVVNVPQQAAPIVNVPAQAAPVVNIPASPPTVGITVDSCSIFIVRENQLIVLDKNTYEVKKTVPLQ